eukprot:84523-Alexandrium_andersonii.AAC.1
MRIGPRASRDRPVLSSSGVKCQASSGGSRRVEARVRRVRAILARRRHRLRRSTLNSCAEQIVQG